MPYIQQSRRDGIDLELGADRLDWSPSDAGDLNFVVSTFIQNRLKDKGLKYAVVNEMIGALECCKLELYRLVAAPYEDEKLEENGRVYGLVVGGEY